MKLHSLIIIINIIFKWYKFEQNYNFKYFRNVKLTYFRVYISFKNFS